MSKIVGVTVGTALSPEKIKEKINPVLSVNGEKPDESGNVKCTFTFEGLTDEEKASLKGDKGEDGGYYKPSLLGGTLIFSPSKSSMPAVGSVGNIKGEKGDKGEQGIQGIQGEKGDKGDKGDKGEDGADGYTPKKGVDYYTEADKTEMVNAVVAALPKYNGEVTTV